MTHLHIFNAFLHVCKAICKDIESTLPKTFSRRKRCQMYDMIHLPLLNSAKTRDKISVVKNI